MFGSVVSNAQENKLYYSRVSQPDTVDILERDNSLL